MYAINEIEAAYAVVLPRLRNEVVTGMLALVVVQLRPP